MLHDESVDLGLMSAMGGCPNSAVFWNHPQGNGDETKPGGNEEGECEMTVMKVVQVLMV